MPLPDTVNTQWQYVLLKLRLVYAVGVLALRPVENFYILSVKQV